MQTSSEVQTLKEGGAFMATTMKRLTFVVTPEMEVLLTRFKKKMFFDSTQSDMIRELVSAGMRALDSISDVKEHEAEKEAS